MKELRAYSIILPLNQRTEVVIKDKEDIITLLTRGTYMENEYTMVYIKHERREKLLAQSDVKEFLGDRKIRI